LLIAIDVLRLAVAADRVVALEREAERVHEPMARAAREIGPLRRLLALGAHHLRGDLRGIGGGSPMGPALPPQMSAL
jgi:hypothetical protein